jgi:hypothetical protein
MAKLTLRLGETKQVAEATMSFRLDLTGQGFPFQPGQFVRVGLSDPPFPDPKGNARSFSIASAPADPFVLVATRMTGSSFKRSLAEAPIGTPVSVGGPAGPFTAYLSSSAYTAYFPASNAGCMARPPLISIIFSTCLSRLHCPVAGHTMAHAGRRSTPSMYGNVS